MKKRGPGDEVDTAGAEVQPERMGRREALVALGAGTLGTVAALASSAEAETLPVSAARVSRAPVDAAPGVEALSLTVSGDSQLIGLNLKRTDTPVQIGLVARNRGTASVTVPWRIAVDGKELRSGIANRIQGGSTFTVTASWNATAGVHTFTGVVDPDNTLREAKAARPDNTREMSAEFDLWATWGDSLYAAVRSAIHSWQAQAHFDHIVINAISATGGPGCLVGPELEPLIKLSPEAAAATGTLKTVRDKFAKVVGAGWKQWQSTVTVPGLPWYPAFAAFPGPEAPPMPNVPVPLVACTSSKLSAMATAAPLETALLAELGELASSANAKKVVDAFASTLSLRFSIWVHSAQVDSVYGKGPIPTFAPPYVPVGPVVAGDVIPTPGHLNKLAF
jgi:hypothetical protein